MQGSTPMNTDTLDGCSSNPLERTTGQFSTLCPVLVSSSLSALLRLYLKDLVVLVHATSRPGWKL